MCLSLLITFCKGQFHLPLEFNLSFALMLLYQLQIVLGKGAIFYQNHIIRVKLEPLSADIDF